MTHSPEPWTGGFGCRIHNADGKSIAMTSADASCFGAEQNQANARRIVACVNACQGIPTESLEQVIQPAQMINGKDCLEIALFAPRLTSKPGVCINVDTGEMRTVNASPDAPERR